MSKLKELFKSWVRWGKKHVFHFVISIIVALLTVSNIIQYIYINALEFRNKNRNKEVITKIVNYNEDMTNLLHQIRNDLEGKIAHTEDELEAKIEIIDSAVNKDEKYNALVQKIRDAITASTNRKISARDLNQIANAVIKSSREWNFTIPQILAQIKAESDFNISAISTARAQGLMQIIPETQAYIQLNLDNPPIRRFNPFNPYHSVRGGCFYLDEQIAEFGSYEEALKAYNWGPHKLREFNAGLRDDMPEETKKYVPRILEYTEFFERYGLE